MKQQKKNGDHSFYLSHELRRPLANMVAIFELLKTENPKGSDHAANSLLLKRALAEFDKAITKYHKRIGR